MVALSFCIATFAACAAVTAKIIPIQVLDDVFEPNSTAAAVGDVLEFHFMPHNHSVVMGEFGQACQPAATGGFYTGFKVVNEGEDPQVFNVRINDTKPMVYYCSQGRRGGGHCQVGMVGIVNSDADSLKKYVEAAAKVELATSPSGGPFGGLFATNPSQAGAGGSSPPPSGTSVPTPSPTTSTAAGIMIRTPPAVGLVAAMFALFLV